MTKCYLKLLKWTEIRIAACITQRALGKYLEEHTDLELREKRGYRRNNVEKQEKTVSWNPRDIYKKRRKVVK